MIGLLLTLPFILFINGIIFGTFCSFIAKSKNRSALNWFILGFLFSVIALLAIVGLPKYCEDKVSDINVEAVGRACPFCAETIKVNASICRFCGKDVSEKAQFGLHNDIDTSKLKMWKCPKCSSYNGRTYFECGCGQKRELTEEEKLAAKLA